MTSTHVPPPGTPAPSRPPGGPTHPTPTRPFAPTALGTGSPWPSRPGGSSGPGGPTGPGRADDLMALADAVFMPPVRAGKEPTPGSAAVVVTARESTGVVAGAGAAFPSGSDHAGATTPRPGVVPDGVPVEGPGWKGRAVGAGDAATFPLPVPSGPPQFDGAGPTSPTPSGPAGPGLPKPQPYPPPFGPLYDALPGRLS